MNKRLIIGLTLSGCCLYVASLFLPAATIKKGADLTQGWELLLLCVSPASWIVGFPFVYFIVNVAFLFSARRLLSHLHGRKSNFYTVLISLSAVASWIAFLFVVDVGVGYFAWTASITLVAVAIWISPNDEESTASLDSEGS